MRNVRMTIWVMAVILSVASIASADVFDAGGANEFTIDFVNISGDASSANGMDIGSGGTFTDPGNFRIGTYEITNDQWNKFTNINGTPKGIPSNAYDGSSYWTGTDVPTNDLSWYEGAQFVNFLNTSTGNPAAYQFTGTQGSSTYNFIPWDVTDPGYDSTNPYRNSNAYYFLPTGDEWVKAAYWNGTGLQTYATKDNTAPDEWSPTGGPNSDGQAAGWNYGYAYPNNSSSNDQPWDVTAGYSPEELNGTFDMMGNISEWMESPSPSGEYLSDSNRSICFGSYLSYDDHLRLSHLGSFKPYHEYNHIGFRVASIPEPTTLLLVGLGGLMLRKRR